MANPRIRCPVVYAGSDKVAELQDVKYKLSSNREAEFTSEGYLAHSDGNVMTGLTCGLVSLVAGFSVDFISTLMKAGSVSIGLPIGGKYHTVTMVVLNADIAGEAKANTCKATIDLEGGPPSIFG